MAEKTQGLLVVVALVATVVQSNPPKKCKAFGKKCYSYGKMNHFITMCRSRNQSQSQNKGKSTSHSTNKPNGAKQNQQNRSHHDFSHHDSYDYEQDSITIVFNMQFRKKNAMFDEISSQPSLQHALGDLHVLDSNSRGKTFCFKVDTGACGNLLCQYN